MDLLLKNPASAAVIPFISGIVAAGLFRVSLIFTICLIATAATISFLLLIRSLPRSSISLVLLSFFFLGCFVFRAHECSFSQDHIATLIQRHPALFSCGSMEISGYIASDIAASRRGTNVPIDLISLKCSGFQARVKGRIRLFIANAQPDSPMPLRPGDRITAYARVRIPRSFGNPNAFDYREFLAGQRIYLQGSVKSIMLVHIERRKSLHPLLCISRLRHRLIGAFKSIAAARPENREAASIALAMTLGIREETEEDTSRTLRMSGIYHIIAISGMNFGIIAIVIFKFLGLLRIPERSNCLMTSLVLLCYLVLSGGRSSAVRAVIMSVSYLIARSIQREVNILNCVSVSAFLILLMNPLLISDPGFQLTYAATVSLLLCYPIIQRAIRRVNFLSSIISATAAAQIGVIPIIAYNFNTVSYFSFLANLAAVPALFVIVPLGLITEMLSLVNSSISMIAASLLVMIVKALLFISSLYVYFPFLSFRIPTPSPLLIAIYYFAGIAYLFFSSLRAHIPVFLRRNHRKFKMLLFIIYSLSLIAISTFPFHARVSTLLRVTFLDVGQGDAAFLVFPDGYSLLIDGGPRTESSFDAGEMVVSKYLFSQGFKRIDCLIASHLHMDHAGGIPSIIRNFTVGQVIISERDTQDALYVEISRACQTKGSELFVLKEDMNLRKDMMDIEIINPRAHQDRKIMSSERSLLVMVRYGHTRLLFTGDSDPAAEDAFAVAPHDLSCEILKIAHHGSSDSTSPRFLSIAHPLVCIISVGVCNQWGHPSSLVLERLRKIGARTVRTDVDGAISISSDGESFFLRSYITSIEEKYARMADGFRLREAVHERAR